MTVIAINYWPSATQGLDYKLGFISGDSLWSLSVKTYSR